ncbi:MAG: ROK family protein [Anaerolineae bacterium]|nr:ROK family protein [Anaerolineae bacterium]
MTLLAGVDIGGTKCAVVLGRPAEGTITLAEKHRFPTPPTFSATLAQIIATLTGLLRAYPQEPLAGIGISCGGPLDSRAGLILSPPNLPAWDGVNVVTPLAERFGVPVALQNDANACALAEWQWGAGRGCRNMIFLTFGTGMGAGLILDGRLYTGTNDLAGEVGHVRLAPDGPLGYGKAGSFEGFCSGGGIANLARDVAREQIEAGRAPAYCPGLADLPGVTAETVAAAAAAGDAAALAVYRTAGQMLGRGLAILIDILNPERIVIGSIYLRQQALLEPVALEVLQQEALALARAVCTIVPAGLGEQVGDYASLAVAAALPGQGPPFTSPDRSAA